ncbi:MAG TPA: ATP-binding protein [Ignavibacteriaceae bacterium]|nr:ATP-binding protein [Ignavibacteriaceae bacterium]
MPENKYHLEIDSDPNNLITVEEFVNYFGRDLNLSEEKIAHLLLTVTEATTNAIIHGNKCDAKKLVVIDVWVENGSLYISVKDNGKGFDPSALPDPTETDNLLKDSGRGVYLMKVYMDEIKFNVTEQGTETLLILKL